MLVNFELTNCNVGEEGVNNMYLFTLSVYPFMGHAAPVAPCVR